jgi:serine/threonine-protein kinase
MGQGIRTNYSVKKEGRRVMSKEAPVNAKIGSRFGNRYQIVSELGRGGNSQVYYALDHQNDPPSEVALKISTPSKGDTKFMARFLREAFQLSRLEHPNIMKLLDFGNENGLYFMATEFIKGKSLKEYLNESPIAEESAVVIACEMAKAFTYMKEMGVIHRDIKPENILISDNDEVILVDFGLAKEEGDKTLSMSDELFGTPQYLSPEYISGDSKITIKTDIYSLGITLFYAVSGQLPFNSKNPVDIVRKQLSEEPPILKDMIPAISDEYSDIISRMIIKVPEERCSLEEMKEYFDKMLLHYI